MNYLKNFTKDIEATNKAFLKANKARKRVMIAKDVIKTLQANEFVANKGSYLSPTYESLEEWNKNYNTAESSTEMREIIPKVGKCNVCAKGAIFVCTVMRRDHLTKDKFKNYDFWGEDLSNMIGNVFSPDQLRDIENAFEGWRDGTKWYSHYLSDRLRLIAIMENIIKNKGTFNISEL